MLCAAIKACPVYGGTVKSYDEAKVAKMPGVRGVVKVKDNAVAVVADTWWRAKTALEALPDRVGGGRGREGVGYDHRRASGRWILRGDRQRQPFERRCRQGDR